MAFIKKKIPAKELQLEKEEAPVVCPESIIEHLKVIAKIKDETEQTMKAFYADKTVPFDDKKTVWLATPHQLEKEFPYILHLKDFEEAYKKEYGCGFSWRDNFWSERRDTVDLREICEDLMEYAGEGDYTLDWPTHLFDAFVQAAVESGYHRFIMDW